MYRQQLSDEIFENPDMFDSVNDTFTYWKNNQHIYVHLYPIVYRALISVWNSADVERSFNNYGTVTCNSRQNRMSRETKKTKEMVIWNDDIISRERFQFQD